MKKFLDSDWLGGVQLYRNLTCRLKACAELLCHSNNRVNDLFCMYFAHAIEREFVSV